LLSRFAEFRMPLPHILLVDDNPVLLQVLPDTLRLRMPELMIDTCLSGIAGARSRALVRL